MIYVIHILWDALLVYLAVGVLYVAVFALASTLRRKSDYAPAPPTLRFRLLYPAYKEDAVIIDSALSALQQAYPKDLYTVCVIADHMQTSTHERLRQLGTEVLVLHTEQSSKAKALTLAMQQPTTMNYDYVVILDADNVIGPHYLQQVNDYFIATGERVLQTHRTAKNQNTPTAVLDAAIEEMNNSIFRTGHTRLGISSSLIGSGMAIDYRWFATHIAQASTAGEDKELEEMLLREGIHIGYAPHIQVYDEKVQQTDAMRRQRRRWIATQLMLARKMGRYVIPALRQGNMDYVLKAVESVIPPRSLLLLLLAATALLALPFSVRHALASLLLEVLLMASMYLAIPRELRGRKLWAAVRRLPSFLWLMVCNLFHLRGASGKFIHTQHG
jgi:cellulose synthase/poly-beta-1,6-N-acetylglucosamine synthase-like glycosyltransferase